MTSIRDDADVARVVGDDGEPVTAGLDGAARGEVEAFLAMAPASGEELVAALAAGAAATEALPDGAAPGWRKLLVHRTGQHVERLWQGYGQRHQADVAAYAQWVADTVAANGWEGGDTAVGRAGAACAAIAAQVGDGTPAELRTRPVDVSYWE